MLAIGVGLAWLGYTWFLYGYCLFKNYAITMRDLMHYPNGYTGAWPPAQRTD